MKRRYLIISMFLLPTLLTGCGQIRSIRLRRQLSLGNKYLLESDYEAAELAMKKAIEIDPKEMQAYLDLAEICRRRGDTAAAADILEDGWNESADISDTMSWQEVTARESVREELSKALIELGDEEAEEGDYGRAAKYYSRVLEYDRDNETASISASRAYARLGDYDKAADMLQRQEIPSEEITVEMESLNSRKTITEQCGPDLNRLAEISLGRDAGDTAPPEETPQFNEAFTALARKLTEPAVFAVQGQEGRYIVIYPDGGVYVGELTGGVQRTGEDGSLWYFTGNRMVQYRGAWSHDVPEGEGMLRTALYENTSAYAGAFRLDGAFSGGRAEGDAEFGLRYGNGSRYTFPVKFSGGAVPQEELYRNYVNVWVAGHAKQDRKRVFAVLEGMSFSVPGWEPSGTRNAFLSNLSTFR